MTRLPSLFRAFPARSPLAALPLLGVLFFATGVARLPAAAEAPVDPLLGAPLTVRERPSLGPENAPIVVIEIRSFQCAHCRAFHESVFPTLREKYIAPGLVRWVRINATPDKADASAAVFTLARCAIRQKSYERLEDFLFTHGHRASSYLYSRAAGQPGIDASQLNACVRANDSEAEVQADFAEVAALKVTVLPTFILRKRQADGQFIETRIEGYPQADYFNNVMERLESRK